MVNFKFKDVVFSETAEKKRISNILPVELMDNMLKSFIGIQKVRDLLKVPCTVNSWYRSTTLNEVVGGSKTSNHMKCLAVDFVPRMELKKAYDLIAKSDIEYDQLIYYPKNGFIHIGFSEGIPRKQLLTL